MKAGLSKITLAAGVMLALAFTFTACSNDEGEENSGGGGGGGKGNDIANYKTKTIGTQVWMAENLNYDVEGSKCGTASDTLTSDDTEYCDTYGRLYDWSTAMALPSSCNSSSCASQVSAKHRGICPSGWHLPTNAEWDALYRYVDGTSGTSSPYDSPTAGRYLKSVTGWSSYSGIVNEDTYGFAALPGGYGNSGGGFLIAGISGDWWSSSEDGESRAYNRGMDGDDEGAGWGIPNKTFLSSVRCLQDNSLPPPSSSSAGSLSSSSVAPSSSSSSQPSSSSGGNTATECTSIFNPNTHFCYDGEVYSKCGGAEYDPVTQGCQGSSVRPKCGTSPYDPATQFCYNDTRYSKCGGMEYDPSKYICTGGVADLAVCGSTQYNPLEKGCCVSALFSLENQRCGTGSVVETKCGTGNIYYNPATHFCQSGTNAVKSFCGSSTIQYTSTQFCKNGTGIETYGSVTSNGQTYNTVVIGEQTWMAENLNYDVAGSRCYSNLESNCAEYGRLYDWSTAMSLPKSSPNCNSTLSTSDASCAVQTKHQGICPNGWHIPSGADWNTLMSFIHADNGLGSFTSGTSNYAGRYLKSASGWNSYSGITNLDSYGFAALPGGGRLDGDFDYAGRYGYWWSASEGSANGAYHRYMYYGSEGAGWLSSGKTYLFSVRCLQD